MINGTYMRPAALELGRAFTTFTTLHMLAACMKDEVHTHAEFFVQVPAQDSGAEPQLMRVTAFNVVAGNVVLKLAPLP